MPTTRQGISSTAIEQLIAQRVANATTAYKANRNNGNGIQNKASSSAGGVEHTARGCSYKEFLNCKPRKIDRTKGAVGLTRWFEKMESVDCIGNYVENCQVKYATCTLLDGALSWWNSYVKTIGLDAAYETTWEEMKKMMTAEYDDIQGKVTSLELTKMQEAIHMAHNLMDQVVRAKAAKDANNNRKWEYELGGNPYQQQNKRQEVVKVYAAGSSDRKGYDVTLPLCDKCKLHHHHDPCQFQCGNCKKVGHQARDCWTPTSLTCYEKKDTSGSTAHDWRIKMKSALNCYKCQ
ncbi:reverse transcriptase domain-containing protein [Tanacetum coccineum]